MIRVRGVSGCAPLRRHTAHLNSNLRDDDGVLLLAPKNRKTEKQQELLSHHFAVMFNVTLTSKYGTRQKLGSKSQNAT